MISKLSSRCVALLDKEEAQASEAKLREDLELQHPAYDGPGQPKPDLSQVEVDLYFFDDGPMAKGLPGQLTSPTENWTAEIFSPPYLFIDPLRRAEITSLEPAEPVNFTASAEVGGQRFTLFHSGVDYRMGLEDLPSCPVELDFVR